MEFPESTTSEHQQESAQEYWNKLMGYAENQEWDQVEALLMERTDFNKMPGEDEIYEELKEKLGREPRVEINKRGIIVLKKES